MNTAILRLILLVPLLPILPASAASPPTLLHHQGRIAVNGVNYDGTGHFKFALVDPSGPASVWSNDGTSMAGLEPSGAIAVAVAKGHYAVQLGEAGMAPLSSLSFSNFPDLRLRIWFSTAAGGPFEQLTPDRRLASAPYAFNATQAQSVAAGSVVAGSFAAGAVHSLDSSDGSIVDALLVDAGGRVGIGTAMPGSALDVAGSVTLSGALDLPASADSATGVLRQAGDTLLHTFGDSNFFAGQGAGNFSLSELSADRNTVVGASAAPNLTNGGKNTAVGHLSLFNTSTGFNNTAVGESALFGNQTGHTNSSFGVASMQNNIDGDSNSAFGYVALVGSTGNFNTALGALAGSNLTTGDNNIMIGANVSGVAGESNTTRIGNNQAATFIDGIGGVTPPGTSLAPVLIDENGQLGTGANAPLTVSTSGANAISFSPNNTAALRLEVPTIGGVPILVGGFAGNMVDPGNEGSVIGGGGAVGGENTITGFAPWATISGGLGNNAGEAFAVVGGGDNNTAGASGAVVGGGRNNSAGGFYATIPGGAENTADGLYSFAAGRQAKALHNGAFVWADLSGPDFATTGIDQFLIRANGGVGIGTNAPQSALDVAGTFRATGFRSEEPTVGSTPNVINGAAVNTIDAGLSGATIAGGGDLGGTQNWITGTGNYGSIGGGISNQVGGLGGTVPGGTRNTADGADSLAAGRRAKALHDGAFVWGDSTAADFASTGIDQFLIRANGGVGIGTNAPQSALDVAGTFRATGFRSEEPTVGSAPNITNGIGGNSIDAGLSGATISGGGDVGIENLINGTGDHGTIGGGLANRVGGFGATVSGGFNNRADGAFAAVAGGTANRAMGDHSFAAGRLASSLHDGTFVWGDNTVAPFESTGTNQFLIRAGGGVGIGTTSPQAPLHVAGAVRASSFEGDGGDLMFATSGLNDLQFKPNGEMALRLEYPTGTGNTIPNLIGGHFGNSVEPDIEGATIAGGGRAGEANRIVNQTGVPAKSDFSTISGGYGNVATGQSIAIGGGARNIASANLATIGGGQQNQALQGGDTVAGGDRNIADGGVATVGGGQFNQATGTYATVPGGESNEATGTHSFAAGHNAGSLHDGSFVWSDSTGGLVSTGPNQFLIDADGGVGIGTVAPAANLHVASLGSVGLLLEADTDNFTESDHATIAWSQDGGLVTGGMGFFDGTNDLRIRSNDSGGGKTDILLEPEGSVRITRDLLENEQLLHLKFNATQAVRGGLMIEHDVPASLGGADRPGIIIKAPDDSCGHFFFDDNSTGPGNYREFNYNHAQDQFEFLTAGTKHLVIESTGEVGIGTQNPQKNLHLHANGSNGPDIFFTDNDTGTVEGQDGVQLGMDSLERGFFWNYETGSSGALYFGAGNAERMRITSTGLVGIGTTSPSATLSVLGTANNSTGTWGFFSDRRMKEDITPMEAGSLDRLLRLDGVSYHYRDEKMRPANGHPQRGWIAQDVEEVFPEWVSETEEGMKMVTPVGFRALAVEALRELREEKDRQIGDLERENSDLKRETEALRERLERLETAVFAGKQEG